MEREGGREREREREREWEDDSLQGYPNIVASPPEDGKSPVSMLNSVVFPAPLGPSRQKS